MGILNTLQKCFVKDVDPAAAELYTTCVAAARRPAFYANYGVPDTVDGRFDLLILHVTLAMLRITDKQLNQHLFDRLFSDMDRSLREMGVGDMSIGKKIKPMLAGFYGRAMTYQKALSQPDDADLVTALSRNLYGLREGTAPAAVEMARYMRSCVSALTGQDERQLQQGHIIFPSL